MSDIEKAAERLKTEMAGPSRTLALALEGVVVVDRADLTLVLERLAELEAKEKPVKNPDRVSNLKVGDKVETLIDVRWVPEGTIGTVADIVPEEYPIKVRFAGTANTGFNRYELGKVEA